MIALFRANPDAFNGNINRLRAGSVLRIPDMAEIEAIVDRRGDGRSRAPDGGVGRRARRRDHVDEAESPAPGHAGGDAGGADGRRTVGDAPSAGDLVRVRPAPTSGCACRATSDSKSRAPRLAGRAAERRRNARRQPAPVEAEPSAEAADRRAAETPKPAAEEPCARRVAAQRPAAPEPAGPTLVRAHWRSSGGCLVVAGPAGRARPGRARSFAAVASRVRRDRSIRSSPAASSRARRVLRAAARRAAAIAPIRSWSRATQRRGRGRLRRAAPRRSRPAAPKPPQTRPVEPVEPRGRVAG